MILSKRELATVLAALSFWCQHLVENDDEVISEQFQDEGITPLTADEVDALCERLNFPDELLTEALEYEADKFDGDDDDGDISVNGADLVDWFSDWRLRLREQTQR